MRAALASRPKRRRSFFVGTTGLGAGLPGSTGIILDSCHPRHLDAVAARFAGLTIIAARPAWPWQSEMIAVLLHKPNVWCELHGWSPRYFSNELKRASLGGLPSGSCSPPIIHTSATSGSSPTGAVRIFRADSGEKIPA